MTAVKNLCRTGIMLSNGFVEYSGQIEDVINHYLTNETAKSIKNKNWNFESAPGNEFIKVKSAFIDNFNERITVKSSFDIVTEFWSLYENANVNVSMVIWDINQNPIYNIFTNSNPLKKGLHKAAFHIPANLMNDGIYVVQNYFVKDSSTPIYIHDNAFSFEVFEDRTGIGWHGKWIGAVRPTFITSDLDTLDSNPLNLGINNNKF